MTTQTHPLDIIPAHALGILDPEEEKVLSQHLASCESCRSELRAYEGIVDAMPLAVRETEPPPALRSEIVSAVEVNHTSRTNAATPSLREQLVNLFRSRSLVYVAALALIGVLVLSNVYYWRQGQRAVPDEFQIVSLAGTDESHTATGLIVFDDEGHEGTMVVDGLSVLDASEQYQLWLVKNGSRDDGGVFSVSDSGYGWLKIESETPLQTYAGFGITIEPAGGSVGPTGMQVMGTGP